MGACVASFGVLLIAEALSDAILLACSMLALGAELVAWGNSSTRGGGVEGAGETSVGARTRDACTGAELTGGALRAPAAELAGASLAAGCRHPHTNSSASPYQHRRLLLAERNGLGNETIGLTYCPGERTRSRRSSEQRGLECLGSPITKQV